MTTAHSSLPTPLRLIVSENCPDEVQDAEGNSVAYFYGTGHAALIVRSVNALEPMREALKGIMPLIDREIERLDVAKKDPFVKPWIETLNKAKAALALASGTMEETI